MAGWYLLGIRCMYDERHKNEGQGDPRLHRSGQRHLRGGCRRAAQLVAVESMEILRRADEQLDLLAH